MGRWVDMQVFDHSHDSAKTRKIKAKGYFREVVYRTLTDFELDHLTAMYKADFIYNPESNQVIKNRYGSIENMYEDAMKLMKLRHHPNENVRRAFEKVETLAALSEE